MSNRNKRNNRKKKKGDAPKLPKFEYKPKSLGAIFDDHKVWMDEAGKIPDSFSFNLPSGRDHWKITHHGQWVKSDPVWVYNRELLDDLNWSLAHLKVSGDDHWSFHGGATFPSTEYTFKALWSHPDGPEKSFGAQRTELLVTVMNLYEAEGFVAVKGRYIAPITFEIHRKIVNNLMEISL